MHGLLHERSENWINAVKMRQAGAGVESYVYEMKVANVMRLLHQDGWYLVAIRGSHRQFKHPVKSGRVTVHGKPSDDLAPGTLKSILKQSGLRK